MFTSAVQKPTPMSDEQYDHYYIVGYIMTGCPRHDSHSQHYQHILHDILG